MICSLSSLENKNLHVLGNPAVPVFLYQVNDKQWILIDGGLQRWYPEVRSDLMARVKDLSLISHWFVTHLHYDHCGLLPLLLPELSDVQVLASNETASAWKKPDSVAVTEKLNSISSAEIIKNKSKRIKFADIPVTTVADGDEVQLDSHNVMKVISTPGHCSSQLAFHLKQKNILFVADALGELTAEGNWNPLIFDNLSCYLSSIKKLSSYSPDLVVTGHNFAAYERDSISKAYRQSIKFIEKAKRELHCGESVSDMANRYSEDLNELSKDFLPDGLHIKSMSRMLHLIQQEQRSLL